MSTQRRLVGKLELAYITSVRPFAGVYSRVYPQLVRRPEALGALRTRVRSLVGVTPDVVLQRVRLRERGTARRARVGLHSGVPPLVQPEVAGPLERVAARRTHVRTDGTVRPLVHAQQLSVGEEPAAPGTRQRRMFRRRRRLMALPVSPEVARVVERETTHGAYQRFLAGMQPPVAGQRLATGKLLVASFAPKRTRLTPASHAPRFQEYIVDAEVNAKEGSGGERLLAAHAYVRSFDGVTPLNVFRPLTVLSETTRAQRT